MNWTAESVELLTKLYNEGMSASAIAAALSGTFDCCVTRNMVIGKSHRMNLAKRTKTAAVPLPAPPKIRLGNFPARIAGLRALPAVAVATKPRPVVTSGAEEKPLALLLMDLEDKQCRWPLDTESEGVRDRWLFCGLPKHFDDSGCKYCLRHLKVSLTEEGFRREMAKPRKVA